ARAAPARRARARVPTIEASPSEGSTTKAITFCVMGSVTPDSMAANVSSVASFSLSITGDGSVRALRPDIHSAVRALRLFVAGMVHREFRPKLLSRCARSLIAKFPGSMRHRSRNLSGDQAPAQLCHAGLTSFDVVNSLV